ncbi:glycoside hydrolase family 97 catalytic domain-containing protein [Pedobacter sp. Du54]|uniref:glycoside hydrolase family 97 protein n=1 Tax=Pedobacter anseongensis TaxID=3133439 RepID=UPI0030AA0903
MNTQKKIILFLLCFGYTLCFAQTKQELSSPDGKITTIINAKGKLDQLLTYTILVKGKTLIKEINIGLQLKEAIAVTGWRIISSERNSVNKSWKPVYGEKNLIIDHYNALSIVLGNKSKSEGRITINFRIYNEGIAYQYHLVKKDAQLTLTKEKSEFLLAPTDTAWVSTNAQGLFKAKTINEIKEASERPMTIKQAEDCYFALGEAGLVDFARMKLINSGENVLSSILSSEVTATSNLKSPWRYVLIGHSPGDLLAKNYLLLNLNAPNEIKNTSWIKPGKVIRENSLTTDGSFEVIDFAAKHNIAYVSFDAGWYGKEDADTSNATRVMVDPARSKGPLDLQRVIAYAKSKNIGILLYVNRRALEKQLDELLPLYKQWGIKGIKFGFVNVGAQEWTTWLHEAIQKAAKYEMLVDVHDEYRPTGYSRTYPNLITQEGVRGDEESPTNETILTTMFTRMLAGAADQTNAYFTKRIDKMGSHTAQLAKTICIYSPLQFIYWYDRPAGKRNNPANEGIINEVPELAFYDSLPTVWDDTKVLESNISKYATIARKKGKDWYIGSLTSEARNLTINCNFLEKGVNYKAIIYADDGTLNTLTKVAIETKIITSETLLSYRIQKNNGLAIRITPIIN